MERLDLSKLNELAAGGFKDLAKKDDLIERGYRIVEPPENPFTAPPASTGMNASPAPEKRSETLPGAYKRMYRAAWDFHAAHNPPLVDRDYWRSHTPGRDEPPPAEQKYWETVALDIAETASKHGNDPFITGLLTAVMDELGREYERETRSA